MDAIANAGLAQANSSPDPWRNLAQLYTLMGDPARARQAADQAAALESRSGP